MSLKKIHLSRKGDVTSNSQLMTVLLIILILIFTFIILRDYGIISF